MLEQIDMAIAFSVVMLFLSLIVTALVQVVSALADLRGRNLASGLSNLFHQIEPAFREKLPSGSTLAQHLAEVVVKHPAVAHAGTRAKAISQSELVGVLRDLCSDTPAADINHDSVKKTLKELLTRRVPGSAQYIAVAYAVTEQLGAKFPAQKNELQAVVDSAASTVSKLESEVNQWFDTIMNRLSDIFTRSTRIITIALSVFLVMILQIDSGEILRQLTKNPDIRAKLAAMSDKAIAEANTVFDNHERAAAAIADVKKANQANPQVLATLDELTPHLTRCVDGKRWLEENAQTVPGAETIEKDFADACQHETLRATGNSYEEIRDLRADLKNTDLQIVSVQVNGSPVFDSANHWWIAFGNLRHLVGTLATVVLLSLGAPFWFNVLRQMSNLKPAISDKVGTPNQGQRK